MKYDNLETSSNKNNFSKMWIVGISLLLFVCLISLGISNKGTNAYVCGSGFSLVSGTQKCCPNSYGTATLKEFDGGTLCYPDLSVVNQYSLNCGLSSCTAVVHNITLETGEVTAISNYGLSSFTIREKINGYISSYLGANLASRVVEKVNTVFDSSAWTIKENSCDVYGYSTSPIMISTIVCTVTAPVDNKMLEGDNGLYDPDSALTYGIKYYLNGGDFSSTAPTKGYIASSSDLETENMLDYSVEIPKPTKEFRLYYNNLSGYDISYDKTYVDLTQTFKGWTVNVDSTGDATQVKCYSTRGLSTPTNTSSVPFNCTYYVNLNVEGGTTYLEANWNNTSVTLPTITPPNENMTCYWSTEDGGSKETYQPGSTFYIKDDLTNKSNFHLYAECNEKVGVKITGNNKYGETLKAEFVNTLDNTTCTVKNWGYLAAGGLRNEVSSTKNTLELDYGYVGTQIYVVANCSCPTCDTGSTSYQIEDKTDDATNGSYKVLEASVKSDPVITFDKTSLSIEVGDTGTVSYNGSTYGGALSCTSSSTTVATCTIDTSGNKITIKGLKAGSSKITLKSTGDNSYNSGEKSLTVTVTEKTSSTVSVTKPTVATHCKTLTYNGSNQTLTNAAATGYTFSNNTGKNANSYTVTATLNSGYTWSDGTTNSVNLTCKINKATPTITLSSTSGKVNVGETENFTVKSNVLGDFKMVNSSTDIASISNQSFADVAANTVKTVTVTGLANGTSTITVSFTPNDTANYNNASNKTYTITVNETEPAPETKQKFVATFDDNGGTLNGNATASCETDGSSCSITNLPTASKEGYTFKGWNTSQSCSTGSISSVTLTKDATFYACYVKNSTSNDNGDVPSDGGNNSSGNNNSKPNEDDLGNTNESPVTGDIAIGVICFICLFAIAYMSYYFQNMTKDL